MHYDFYSHPLSDVQKQYGLEWNEHMSTLSQPQ